MRVSMVTVAPAPVARLTGLPHEVTSFVGRRSDRGEVRQALAQARLVTLTGFGGVGKTRLALAVAADLRRAFADGVCLVSLGSLTDPDLIAQAAARALGMRVRSRQAPAESLVGYLRSRHLLLVLDNCEHVVEAAAMLSDTLIRSCPRLRILATSREPLRVDGESVHAVAPLTIPAPQAVPEAQSESETLFLDRARAVVPHFTLTPANRNLVAEICRQLEGIPLAIELAAVRLRSMSVPELARDLADHWAPLTRGSRAAPARQRTMAACIDWSFTLCSPAERDVWAGVSVFAGGFEFDAASTVCGDLAGAENLADVLAALVDKSIITAQEHAGHMRFRLLPPIRHHGLRRLAELGLIEQTMRRHRDWCADLAARASDEWLSPRQVEWIARIGREEGNLQAALAFCAAEPDGAAAGLLMGARLLELGLARGLIQAGKLWFERLLPLATEPTVTRVLALRTACWWSAAQGDIELASALLAEGQRLAADLGEPTVTLLTQARAFVSLFAGDAPAAIALFDRAIVGFQAAGDRCQLAQSLYLLALAHALAGHYDEALACHVRCLAITRPADECCMRSYSLWIAGFAHWRSGDDGAAAAAFRESLELSHRISDPVVTGLCLEAMAWMSAPASSGRAAALLGAATRQWERAGTSTLALPALNAHHEDCLRTVEDGLGAAAAHAAWDDGACLAEPEAIRFALGTGSPGKARVAADSAQPGGEQLLTRRQLEIARLVAQGRSNGDIADALVISKRTAETHVENILTKLGFTTRHQIAAWVNGQSRPAAVRDT